ncbi:hypothetical protein HDU98_005109, partial [Podochytrium sp. JEL0797]
MIGLSDDPDETVTSLEADPPAVVNLVVSNDSGDPKDPPTSRLTVANYQLKPFDTVLFAGNDAVANLISRVSLKEVVPNLKRPFHRLWTHSGILVDSTVLPLKCLQAGKLYLYESVFSGKILGVTYSAVVPVDRWGVNSYLGPQIRDFEAVVAEAQCDVAICPLSESSRFHMNQVLTDNPRFLLDLYAHYQNFSYPLMNILRVVASANEKLYASLEWWEKQKARFRRKSEPRSVFCSQLVATIYKEARLPSFVEEDPRSFSPLELEVVEEF